MRSGREYRGNNTQFPRNGKADKTRPKRDFTTETRSMTTEITEITENEIDNAKKE